MIEVTKCRCCNSDDLVNYFSLGKQPIVNNFSKPGEGSHPKYPLQINVCRKCYHSQLSNVVDLKELYSNYSYVSGTSDTLDKYFSWFVNFTEQYAVKGSILEIGCNDGTQLKKFRDAGWEVLGVDPAINLHPKNISVITGFWGDGIADQLDCKYDVVVAQNVFGHVHDVDGFLAAVERCLKPGAPLLIQTSQANMVVDGQFDTIYHEHLSYFNARSMCALANRNGWRVDSIDVVPIHGGSYIFRLSKGGVNGDSTICRVQLEKTMGVYEDHTYAEFANKAYVTINELDAFIEQQLMFNNKQVVGYGASAKGVVMLNVISSNLKYVVDENPLKYGKLMPGTDTLIVSQEHMNTWNPEEMVYVVLAWNFFVEICEKIKSRTNNKSMIYTYLPHPIVYVGDTEFHKSIY